MPSPTALSLHPQISDTIRKTLQKSAGARFHKCALQVNPFSYYERYPKPHVGVRFTSEAEYNTAMIAAAKANGVDAIAITDHFRVDTIGTLQAAAKEAGILTFPGFEANSSDGIHLLCIFPPDKQARDLMLAIGACGVRNLDVPSPHANVDCHSLLNIISTHGGLCIAPHACSANGILKDLTGQSRIRAWTNENLLAVALPGPRADAPQGSRDILFNKDLQYRRPRPIAVVNAADISLPTDFSNPSCTVYIKMFEPTIEGLRQAFLDFSSRIRLNSEAESEASAEISAIAWDGGFLDGQGIRFNNGLNVLIGGRGAGKSAVIESLRYAFDYQIRGGEAKKTHEAIIKSVLAAGTRVSVLVQDAAPSAKTYLVERVVPNRPTVRGEDGIIISGLHPTELVPGLEIFGQHELSELTRKREELAKIVERFMDAAEDHVARQKEVERRLEDSRQAIEAAETEVSRLEQDTSALPKLLLDLSRMDDLDLSRKLQGKLDFASDEEALQALLSGLTADRAEVASVSADFLSFAPSDRANVQETYKLMQSAYSSAASKLAEALVILDGAAINLGRAVDDHNSRRSSVDAEYAAIIGQLKVEGIDADAYLSLKSQVKVLELAKQTLTSKQSELDNLRAERIEIVNGWENLKAEKLRDLKAAARAAGRALEGAVRVQVDRGATLHELEDVFKANIEGSGARIAIERLRGIDDLSLPVLAQHVREGAAALVREYKFTDVSAQKIAGAGNKLAMQIEAVELHAEAMVQLNVSTEVGQERWKRIEELSAGQKATAVLLLLLGGSTSPLIVDQPEDDLDNRFIASTIVETMRQEKTRRQFVFSSHNANIPVLGDAEQIVYLHPTVSGGSERTEVPDASAGSIDNEEVRRVIGEVLEGGREAFELRRAKYGY